MSRVVNLIIEDQLVQREMPPANDELLPGVCWGDPWRLFTPAYWLAQAWMAQADTKISNKYRARDGVVNELVFCLLGGFGITADLATAAYERCRDAGLLDQTETSVDAWSTELRKPFEVNRKLVKYRYPNQKARYLSEAMAYVRQHQFNLHSGRALRDQLLEIQGVGYKTASWVARNVLDSDDVAILDIHLVRAGRLCGLFSLKSDVQRNYLDMEARFLEFSEKLQIRPAILDCLIWDEMRAAGSLPISLLDESASGGKSETGRLTPRRANMQLRLSI
jgi:N-glycosylase/DNA lyase